MINYTNRKNTLKLIEIELSSLKATLDIQKNLNKQILTFMKTFLGSIELQIDFDTNNTIYKYISDSTNILNKSTKNIKNLESLIKRLSKLCDNFDKISVSLIKEKIEKYNKSFTKAIDSIYSNTSSIESFIHDISLIDLSKLLSNAKTTSKSKDTENDFTIETSELENSFIENTLIISDIKNKVILPYTLQQIKEILVDENKKYTSIQDVIDKKYTIPLSRYKISSLARFKEAYRLVVEKEHSSHLKALSLASELFFNYNLHPAIITACNSLDELDIYLACLDDNTLEDFKYFNIKYEIAPIVSKDNKIYEEI